MIRINNDEPASVQCARCGFRRVCFSPRVPGRGPGTPHRLPIRHRQLARGAALFHAGDRLSAVYALRSGCVKEVVFSPEGDELVTGFYLPGELLGLSALPDKRFRSSAVAVEPTRSCEIPWRSLAQSMAMSPEIATELIALTARAASAAQDIAVSVMRRSALSRVAGFLLAVGARRRERGLHGQRFRLGLRRRDIASYLGLTLETVSRSFSELARRNLIRVRAKQFELLRLGDLQRTALGGSSASPQFHP
ncbi:MAG TPA: helix-turn-helix domain-containing protein [Steroidobacteraceae bacterium]